MLIPETIEYAGHYVGDVVLHLRNQIRFGGTDAQFTCR